MIYPLFLLPGLRGTRQKAVTKRPRLVRTYMEIIKHKINNAKYFRQPVNSAAGNNSD